MTITASRKADCSVPKEQNACFVPYYEQRVLIALLAGWHPGVLSPLTCIKSIYLITIKKFSKADVVVYNKLNLLN